MRAGIYSDSPSSFYQIQVSDYLTKNEEAEPGWTHHKCLLSAWLTVLERIPHDLLSDPRFSNHITLSHLGWQVNIYVGVLVTSDFHNAAKKGFRLNQPNKKIISTAASLKVQDTYLERHAA